MLSISFNQALFWVAAASCLVAQVAIVRSTIATRRLRAAAAEVDPNAVPVAPRSTFALEMLWAAIPALALGAVLWFTWQKVLDREASTWLAPHVHAVATAEGR